ncbi:hypothetical protein PRK78_001843 [Emydomyces testavorans]|uniref:Uncharacterized protein n=1 Tax=Emydomyces testavorans TaxID=2070801 RepID=A0AAF0DDH3_9EURO|nr:hypothetical protein PRK78_001843 [Emydomyces testavorans]
MPLGASSVNSKLRRSESSASVKTRRRGHSYAEPIDNEVGQRQALTAASLAMQRATRSSIDELRGSETRTSHSSFQSSRPQSIRFSNSDASNSHGTRKMESVHPPPPPPPKGHVIQGKETETPPVQNEPASGGVDEFGMLTDDTPFVSSVPSSYRKLRKSKSMFSTRLRSAWLNDSSRSPKRNQHSSQYAGPRHFARSTLRRSLSFFKGESESHSRRHQSGESQESADRLARDQFLRELSRTSQADTFGSDVGRWRNGEPRPFRKSVRPLSSIHPSSEDGPAQERSAGGHHRVRARRLSQSIKNGLRRIFGRPVTPQEDISSQQSDATSVPLSDYNDSGSHFNQRLSISSTPNAQYCHQGNSSINSYSRFPGHRSASIRSMKSLESISTSNSRVTSWTDSTTTNTLNMRHPAENRLSIIQEHGEPYRSLPTKPPPHYHDGYSVFRQPLCVDGIGGNPVDSQRVYSALMRKIDDSNTKRKQDGTLTSRLNAGEGSGHRDQSSGYSQQLTPSIRQVPSEASMRHGQPIIIPPRRSPSVRSYRSAKSVYAVDTPGLTPQQIARCNENITRHQSRRSLRRFNSNLSRSNPHRHPGVYNTSTMTTPTRAQGCDSDDDSCTVVVSRSPTSDNLAVSPSVYSRTTSGNTPGRHESHNDLSHPESDDDRGTATIITSQRLPYEPRGRDRTIKGSAEWKSWMRSQMDFIDSPILSHNLDVQFVNKDRTHYREDAQIHDGSSDTESTNSLAGEGQSKRGCVEVSGKSAEETQVSDYKRQPLSELKRYSQSNFSRPLRCSPSSSVAFGTTNARKPSVVTEVHTPPCSAPVIVEMNVHPKASAGSIQSRTQSRTPNHSPLVCRKTRLSDTCRSPTASPQGGFHVNSRASTRNRHGMHLPPPSYGGGTKKGFQSVHSSSMYTKNDGGSTTKENREMNENEPPELPDGLYRLSELPSTISSKRMVDIFLSDRRRLRGVSEDSSNESAFL